MRRLIFNTVGGGAFLRLTPKAGFTLAEVLITLGIIGVVAALTMPSLIQNHKVKTTVVKLKKMNSVLSQAYQMYLRENEIMFLEADEEGAIQAFKVFEPYLKIAKDCGTSSGDGCVYKGAYRCKNGTLTHNYSNNNFYYKVLLADGASIWFRGGGNADFNIDIFYDINGDKGPNKWGHDLFEFLVTDKGVYANGSSALMETASFDIACAPENAAGYGCAAWVIYNENMDYLKCSDLSWTGKSKCD